MFRVFAVIVLMHVTITLGQETFPGTCAQFAVSSMPFFNKAKYMGLWYIHGLYNYPDVDNAECLTSIYKLSLDGNATIIEKSKKNNAANRIDSLMIFDKPGFGEYDYVIPNEPEFTIRVQVMSTDYFNYSIEWTCTDKGGESECFIWLMSRWRQFNILSQVRTNKVLDRHHINTTKIRKIKQDLVTCAGYVPF